MALALETDVCEIRETTDCEADRESEAELKREALNEREANERPAEAKLPPDVFCATKIDASGVSPWTTDHVCTVQRRARKVRTVSPEGDTFDFWSCDANSAMEQAYHKNYA